MTSDLISHSGRLRDAAHLDTSLHDWTGAAAAIDLRRPVRAKAGHPLRLAGRDREIASMRAMLDLSPRAAGSALVLRGEPGIGRTALLDAFAAAAPPEVRVLRTAGVPIESEIRHAGLHRLLYGLLPSHASVPPVQRAAMHTAFGLGDGPSPDRFHLALATVSVLTEAAASRPVLCVIDDAHWLDRESLEALAFMARRVPSQVAVIFTVPDSSDPDALHPLPTLNLSGLDQAPASELLATTYGEAIDQATVGRVFADLGGNPLALVSIAESYPDVERLTRGAVGPSPLRAGAAIERRFADRLDAMTSGMRNLLLVAAADRRIEVAELGPFAEEAGVGAEWICEAEASSVIGIVDGAVQFRHPLVRSACYWSASPSDRRRAHAVLAETGDPERDLERRAWHLALSVNGPDEGTASVLTSAARLAAARGQGPSQIELHLRAAELSVDTEERCRRYLAAAIASGRAGDQRRHTRLVERARASTSRPNLLAEVGGAAALGAAFQGRFGSAAQQLLRSAVELDAFDRGRARAAAFDALSMFAIADPWSEGVTPRMLARAVRAMPRASTVDRPSVTDLVLDGYAAVVLDGWAAGAPELREALRRWRSEGLAADTSTTHGDPPWWAVFVLWEHDSLPTPVANATAAVSSPTLADPRRWQLLRRIRLEVARGQFAEADLTASELSRLSVGRSGTAAWQHLGRAELLAWRGRREEALVAIEALLVLAREQQFGYAEHMAQLASAVLANGSRRYADAAAAARPVAGSPTSEFGSQALVELAEALAHLDERVELEAVLADIDVRALAGGSPLAMGTAARARAIAGTGSDADRLFRRSIDLLGDTSCVPELARAHLSFGEWLRRDRRPTEARHHLHEAYDLFLHLGALSFTARARAELRAAGEQEPQHDRTSTLLTAQERQVARLASQGLTNKEIATHLYLSASTIDFHLRKVYRKLGIASRRQLAGRLD